MIKRDILLIFILLSFLAKRQETPSNAVDDAIISFMDKQTSLSDMNADDLFHLSISRRSQMLNETARIRFQTKILDMLCTFVQDDQNKN